MSMNTYPASGYLITLTQIKETLEKLRNAGSSDARELLLKLDVDPESEYLEDICDWVNEWFKTVKCDISVDTPFIASDEQAPELLDGEIYFWVDEDDLFVKHETKAHEQLKKLNLVPTLGQWTTFG